MPSKKRVRLRIGKTVDGQYVYKSFYGDTKKEAAARRDEYVISKARGRPGRTLGQLAEYYVYTILPVEGLADGTVELYWRQYTSKIKGAEICLKDAADLQRADLQAFFSELAAGRRDGRKISVSASALINTGKIMRRITRWASQEGFCEDLMQGVRVPDISLPVKEDISVFTREEIRKILDTPNRLHFAFVLAFATGLREGELLGLRYTDIRDGDIHVRQQLRETHDISPDGAARVIKSTGLKSKSSNRVVPIPEPVLQELAEHRTRQREELGRTPDLVFTTSSGKHLDPANFRTAWGRHLRRAGVQHRKFHACRATYCTELCKAGVPLETASKLMGHADVSVTAKHYRAVTADETREAAHKLGPIFAK